MNEVVVVIGAGSIGQAITRRVSAGKHLLMADLRPDGVAWTAVITFRGDAVRISSMRRAREPEVARYEGQ